MAGAGLACVWGPAFALATRNLQPHLAGVASGVLNTLQELGGVLASAAIGALLQNRLATGLHAQAVAYAGQLRPALQAPFIAGFADAAQSGLEVGRGQTGGDAALPANLPAAVAQQLQQLGEAVFQHAFVAAMRPTLALPIILVLGAAVCCFGVRCEGAAPTSEPAPEREAVAV